MKNTRSEIIMKTITILSAIAVLSIILSCKKDERKTAIAVFMTGDVKYHSAGAQDTKPVVLHQILVKNDTVITGSSSEVTIQIGTTAVITIVQNSKVRLESIMESGNTRLFLDKGIVLNKVGKLQKDEDYSVRTKTALAAVRGTEFMVIADKGQSRVAVNSGKVEVTRLENNEEKNIEYGYKALIDSKYRVEPINELDALYFEKLSIMPFIDVIILSDKEKVKEAYNGVKEKSEKIDLKIKELSPMSLKEIRKKYNRIDIVTLYSGKVIEGAIISRGEMFSILTPRGLETVAKKDVKRVNIKR